MVADLLGLLLLGFFIAFAIALTGVGAGTLTAPTLILLGFDPAKAVGSALLFSTLVKLPAGLFHMLYKNLDYKTLRTMLLGGLPGVFTGSYLLSEIFSFQAFKKTLLFIIGQTILASLLFNLVFLLKGKRIDLTRYAYLLSFLCFLIGVEVGLTSAGAGALGMVLLLYFTRLEPNRCVGTDIAFGLACSFVGGSLHMMLGHFERVLLLPMGLGGLLGVYLGTKLTRIVNPKPLRLVISAMLLVVALNLLYRSFTNG